MLPFAHSYGLSTCLNLAFLTGSAVVLVSGFEPEAILKTVRRHHPTLFPGVPSMYAAINDFPKVRDYEIASVKARRVDIMHGMMGWNKQRIKVINISDPIYYGGANITQKKGQNWDSIKDLEGKRVATITGFGWIDQLKSIKDLKLSLYDTSDAAIRDLIAGRVEALFADPPLVQYAISKNPQWNLHALPVKDKNIPELPLLTSKYHIVFGLSKEAPNLLKAVNEKIGEMWQTCLNRKIAEKYGLGDDSWFTPGNDLRAGEGPDFDRPVGWQQPVSPASCK